AAILGALGIYVAVTALPWGVPRPSLAEQLRRFDADVRVAERTRRLRAQGPLLPWPSLDAVLRPLLEDLVGPVRRMLSGVGGFGSDLDRELRLVRPGTDARRFIADQLVLSRLAVPVAVAVGLVVRGRLGADVLALAGLAP